MAQSKQVQENQTTRVKVGLKFVKNLGNYESIHIDLGVEDYVRENENVDEAMNRVYNYVESKLLEKAKDVEDRQ